MGQSSRTAEMRVYRVRTGKTTAVRTPVEALRAALDGNTEKLIAHFGPDLVAAIRDADPR